MAFVAYTRLKSTPCCFKLKWCQLNNDFTSYKFLLLKSRNLYGGKVVNHLSGIFSQYNGSKCFLCEQILQP